MSRITRRRFAQFGAAGVAAAGLPGWTSAFGADETETHGLSTFGELALPPDFKHFAYVNPNAPTGGTLAIELLDHLTGNQNGETFDTLHIYTLKGDGAPGMDGTFDTLMAGNADEPESVYGLVARSARMSADGLTLRFMLRKEARFHDGSPLTARDVAFSLTALRDKGHPNMRALLAKIVAAEAEADDTLLIRFAPDRSRDLHVEITSLPIFSAKWWEGRDFEGSTLEAPLASGPYKFSKMVVGRTIEFERVKDYWAKDLPVNVGQNNFDRIRYECFRDNQVAFEALKSGLVNYFVEVSSKRWNTGYDFPAFNEGRVKKEKIQDGKPTGTRGWWFNTRRPAFKDPRVREAIGMLFDFEWTNKNIMFSSYKRMQSYVQNQAGMAVGKPPADELAILEAYRGKVPNEVFGEPFSPPVSDGSGSDRTLLRKADELFKQAGLKRDGGRLLLPDGAPLTIEFLAISNTYQPHTEPFQSNMKKLGIDSAMRVVDPAQYQKRRGSFDFDMILAGTTGTILPNYSLIYVYGSKAASQPGSLNLAGVTDPVVDDIINRIGQGKSQAEVELLARVLDRVLRAGRYWVPGWYSDTSPLAYWDVFARPEKSPKFSTGAPGTWWWDAAKAQRIGVAG